MIYPTHIKIIPQFDFKEGLSQTAECGKTLAFAVAIDSQDGTIPTISCETCDGIAKKAAAVRSYYVVFSKGKAKSGAVREQ